MDFKQREAGVKCHCPLCYSTPELVEAAKRALRDGIDKDIFNAVELQMVGEKKKK